MGAWGLGPFDNDTAADLADDLADDLGDPALVVEQLTEVLAEAGDTPPDEPLDADLGAEALAAAEVVAALAGHPGEALAAAELAEGDQEPPSLDVLANWCRGEQGAGALDGAPGLPRLALRAVVRVMADGSELAELWDEAPEQGRAWREVTAGLRARLSAAG